jgi:hypothetical protein
MPVWAREFFLLWNVQVGCGGPRNFLFSGYRGSSPGVKRPGREVNHSPPSSDDVKNKWSYTSTALICLNNVDREKFTFSFLSRFATNVNEVKID